MIDQVIVEIEAGKGGDGAVSFRREKFVPRGGPDGGRGGRGGNVIIVANGQLNTLRRYRRRRRFRAESGVNGGGANKSGRDGTDLVLEVPMGTVVSRVRAAGKAVETLADLAEDGDAVIAARGGHGGYGNTHFKSATQRAPRVAQRGEPGEVLRIKLELRLIADVGLVGLPNAGKSTLLRQLSAARPRVADYPFTTLEPYLGVVALGYEEFVVADLPGLIEGAAAGAGLGHDFLRHVSRTRLLVHLIDGGEPDPRGNYETINHELAAYSADLAARRQIVVVNKVDDPAVAARHEELGRIFRDAGPEVLFISAASGQGTQDLVQRCMQAVAEEVEREAATRETVKPVVRPQADGRRFEVERAGDVYIVHGRGVERFVRMMDLEDEEARDEIYRWLERRGVAAALRKAGIAAGDTVRVGEAEWEWET